jgi:hypothetical protein
LSDPPLADRLCAVKGAVQDNPHNGVKGVRGEPFRASDEVPGGVVNERIDFAKLLLGLSHGGFDRGVIAYVARRESGGATKPENFFACFAKRFLAPANQKHSRAQFGKAQSHGTPESSAAAGDKDRPILE